MNVLPGPTRNVPKHIEDELILGAELDAAKARITKLEQALRDFKDQPHACIDRDGPVTLLECPICILKIRARKLLEKP